MTRALIRRYANELRKQFQSNSKLGVLLEDEDNCRPKAFRRVGREYWNSRISVSVTWCRDRGSMGGVRVLEEKECDLHVGVRVAKTNTAGRQ